jgi:hypothetical protein
MYSEQTYSTAPTGWSPIRALTGAQPYEWYVTFKNLFSCIQGTMQPYIVRRGRLEQGARTIYAF